ncbi:MAG: hypothetical protein R3324_06925, partial [Halobacteriales archaeon]|nr:hypothetical protein [Halobacteriales archaeon]
TSVLLIATTDGVFRTAGLGFDTAKRVLDCGHTERICVANDGTVYAAARSGLHATADAGDTWATIDLPAEEAWTVMAANDAVYAGTYPARIIRSASDQSSWDPIEGFDRHADGAGWIAPHDPTAGRVMAIAVDPGDANRLVAGIEIGGVHTSADGGETWVAHGAVPDDVHHVLAPAAGEYIVSTGMLDTDHLYGPAGLYRTRDGGSTWSRLDQDLDRSYFRETFRYDGVLYAAATRGPPPSWDDSGADAALYESRNDGASFEAVGYPGEPAEFVFTWASVDDRVVAGTGPEAPGHLLTRTAEGWERVGRVPAGIRSIATV